MMMRVWGLILLALTLGGCATNITRVSRSLDRLAPGATGSLTAGIPARPMLQVDLPSAINQGVVDAAGRWFVTGGEDKTARVWSVDQGHQVAVLRPPAGEGQAGDLTAIAITPDGGTVALGWRSADAGAILLFDRASARLTGRIAGLINVVTELKISPNGSLIAATTAGGGLQVFDLTGGTERGRDAPYGDDATSVDFSPDGTRIVTVAFDGLVRLYSIDGGRLTRLMAKDITLTGLGLGPPSKPSLVRYSPDGSTIAVGYHNVFGQAEMLDAKSLAQIGKAWWRGNRSNASPIAWSADGRSFYAGGYDAEGVVVRRTLPVDMGGAKKEFNTLSPSADIRIPEKNGIVTTLQPLRSGGFLIATRGGNWGVLGVDNKIAWRQGAVVDRFANYVAHAEAPPQLLLSQDASQVAFSYAGRMGSAADTAFDVGSRRVSADMTGLLPARTQAPGFALATYQPAMAPHDYVTGYAITPDGKGVALSSLFATSFFSIDGRLLWRRPFRSFAVNVSPDGRWVVTDDREGLRWFRTRDGQEVMRFTPAAGGKKWILATPEGYFDASVGGEDILGWQVNHGVEQAADFYPVSLLRKEYYRPDIVTSALSRDGAPARPQAMPDIAGLLPPTIRIVSPDNGNAAAGSPVSVRYAVRSRPGQDVWIKVRFDGRPEDDRTARGARPAAAGEVQDSIRVTPPAGTQTVELLAESDTGVSLPAVLRLRPAPAANPVRPKLYVLAIGVSAYARQALKLGYPAKDADDFARVMKTHGRLYRDSDIRVLSDATATRARIIDGLKWLRAAPGPGDMAMLFMAGHGASGPAGAYYYLPQDADPADLQRTGVSNRDLIEAVSAIRGRVILFLDTCHAGATLSARNTGLVNELIKAENGAVVFASSTGDQFSLEHPDWGNGAFTKELVAGLAGGADPFRKGSVSVADLNSWLSARVPALTGGKQHPAFASPHTIPDFAIAQ